MFMPLLALAAFTADPIATQLDWSAAKETARRSVLSQLTDPESARFEWSKDGWAKGKKGQLVVCGRVNAKNSFGGYAGFTNFAMLVDPETGRVIGRAGLAEDGGVWTDCRSLSGYAADA